jgi:hypothetical protein
MMSKFIALAAVLAMLAAAASAKTLKITKSEVVQHRAGAWFPETVGIL